MLERSWIGDDGSRKRKGDYDEDFAYESHRDMLDEQEYEEDFDEDTETEETVKVLETIAKIV